MLDSTLLSVTDLIAFIQKMGIFLIALAALIFVHELGHFLIARRFRVQVEKFSLGFGPKIFGVRKGETEYLISAIPLGGYVKMKGEDPTEKLKDQEGSFSSAPVGHRLAIAFAGPLFNIIFSILIYIVVYLNGVPSLTSIVGTVKPGSPAQVSGLQTGDRIIQIDEHKIQFWEQIQNEVHDNPGKQMEFLVERNTTKILNLPLTPVTEEIFNLFGEKEKVGLIGITPLVREVTYLEKGGVAEQAGIQIGDQLLNIDGFPFRGWADLKKYAIDKPGEELTFLISRNGIEQKYILIPEPRTVKNEEGRDQNIGSLGIGLSGEMDLEQYGVWKSFLKSLEETWRLTYLIAVAIKKMLVGTVPADSIGGPILIFQIYGEQAEQGFNQLIRLTALLSINLGLLNLLPIPVLDGGHIFFFLIEIIKGRPVSEKNRERAQQVGLFLLLSLMVFAFYNDVMRIMG